MEEEVDLVTTEECREFGNLRKCIIVYVGACEWENYVNYIQAGDWQLEFLGLEFNLELTIYHAIVEITPE